jgi:hypothetical protein
MEGVNLNKMYFKHTCKHYNVSPIHVNNKKIKNLLKLGDTYMNVYNIVFSI